MPVYALSCGEHEFEAYVPSFNSENPKCKECSAPTERVWRTSRHIPASAFPYVTRNIHPDGRPIEVKSASHLDSLCKRYNVVHRPDAAYIEKEYQGYDLRTGKQVYKEGSGRGVKGAWI
jgi:hypothetical protein